MAACRPDFIELRERFPEILGKSVGDDGRVDWSNHSSVKALTKAILLNDFSINIELPDDRLCPPVPNRLSNIYELSQRRKSFVLTQFSPNFTIRLSYIMWLSELTSLIVPGYLPRKRITDEPRSEQPIRVLDIGVGASCIYPFLGFRKFGWSFIGSDIDATSLQWARDNLSRNVSLGAEENIKLVQVEPHKCNLLQSQLAENMGVLYPVTTSSCGGNTVTRTLEQPGQQQNLREVLCNYNTDTVDTDSTVKETGTDFRNDDSDEYLASDDARKAAHGAAEESKRQNALVLGPISRCIQSFKEGSCSRGITDTIDISVDVKCTPRGPVRIALDAAATKTAAADSLIVTVPAAAAAPRTTSNTGRVEPLVSLGNEQLRAAATCLDSVAETTYLLPVDTAESLLPLAQMDQLSDSQLHAAARTNDDRHRIIGDLLTACMTNPPFYAIDEEIRSSHRTICTGSSVEMCTVGGEVAFVAAMIADSLILRESVIWYTAMLGKKSSLKFLLKVLKLEGITNVRTTRFDQGGESRTMRWGLAWSLTNIGEDNITDKDKILAPSKRKRKRSLLPTSATTTATVSSTATATATSTEATATKMTRKMIRAEKRAKLQQEYDVATRGDSNIDEAIIAASDTSASNATAAAATDASTSTTTVTAT